jgi:hypothetical protein
VLSGSRWQDKTDYKQKLAYSILGQDPTEADRTVRRDSIPTPMNLYTRLYSPLNFSGANFVPCMGMMRMNCAGG